ncbi:hypothetical protein [Aureimonas psammosilenae]|uniref:hypothetical protein n=1 Tax=Aureimonas psammosilenae TaxID=2495496 RepID=UPI001260FF05|nr:hypothetical protein [Aureimonas psammosilenae]
MSNQLKETLLQAGVKGRSGRYKLGSGARPYQDDRFKNSPLRKSNGIGSKLKSLIGKGSKKTVNEVEEVSKKKLTEINERKREQRFIDMYKHRDKMSTSAIREQIKRIEAENDFRDIVYTQQRARERAEAEAVAAKKARNRKRLAALAGVAANVELEKLIKDPNSSQFFTDKNKATKEQLEAFQNAVLGAQAMRKSVKTARKVAGAYNQYYKQMNGGK